MKKETDIQVWEAQKVPNNMQPNRLTPKCIRASLVAQTVKDLPTMWETWVGKIAWRREWLLIPVFLPGVFHGWRR